MYVCVLECMGETGLGGRQTVGAFPPILWGLEVHCGPLEPSPEELNSLALCPGDLGVAEGRESLALLSGLP